MRFVTENEGHVEYVHVIDDRANYAERDTCHLDRTELSLLHSFFFLTQHCAREHLNLDPPIGRSIKLFTHPLNRGDRRVASGMGVMGFDHQILRQHSGRQQHGGGRDNH